MNKTIYDQRYKAGYMADFSDLAEADRVISLKNSVHNRIVSLKPRRILDYGCGQGGYFSVWWDLFPNAELYAAEISKEAINLTLKKYPEMKPRISLIEKNNAINLKDRYFDLILSVEVIEHVEELFAYLEDIYRPLSPGGFFIWTTPCGNPYSLEWFRGILMGKIQVTQEGFRRFAWEDSAHLRRLKTNEILSILKNIGYEQVSFNFRSHFFGTIAYQMWLRTPRRIKLGKILLFLAHLDYLLFRRLPNAASMIGIARKPKHEPPKSYSRNGCL